MATSSPASSPHKPAIRRPMSAVSMTIPTATNTFASRAAATNSVTLRCAGVVTRPAPRPRMKRRNDAPENSQNAAPG